MSTAAKLFNKMVLIRLRDLVDDTLRPNQNGFRPNRSCAQHILVLRGVIEHCETFADTFAVITFIDFSKAFDSVHRSYLCSALEELAVATSSGPSFQVCIFSSSKLRATRRSSSLSSPPG